MQYNQLGDEQGLKSKSKITLSEEEGECIIAEIFSCSPGTVGLLSNLKSVQSAHHELVQSKGKIRRQVTQENWHINFVGNTYSGICGVI